MIEIYKTPYGKKVIAIFFSGNVQWHFKGSKEIVKKKKTIVFDSTRENLIKTSEIKEEINMDEIEGSEEQIQTILGEVFK